MCLRTGHGRFQGQDREWPEGKFLVSQTAEMLVTTACERMKHVLGAWSEVRASLMTSELVLWTQGSPQVNPRGQKKTFSL